MAGKYFTNEEIRKMMTEKVKNKYTDIKELVQECMDLASDWDVECDEEFILNILIKAATKSGWDYEINKLYFDLCSSYDVACEMLDFD